MSGSWLCPLLLLGLCTCCDLGWHLPHSKRSVLPPCLPSLTALPVRRLAQDGTQLSAAMRSSPTVRSYLSGAGNAPSLAELAAACRGDSPRYLEALRAQLATQGLYGMYMVCLDVRVPRSQHTAPLRLQDFVALHPDVFVVEDGLYYGGRVRLAARPAVAAPEQQVAA